MTGGSASPGPARAGRAVTSRRAFAEMDIGQAEDWTLILDGSGDLPGD